MPKKKRNRTPQKHFITIAKGEGVHEVSDRLKRAGFRWVSDMRFYMKDPAMKEPDRMAMLEDFKRLGVKERLSLSTMDWNVFRA